MGLGIIGIGMAAGGLAFGATLALGGGAGLAMLAYAGTGAAGVLAAALGLALRGGPARGARPETPALHPGTA